MDCGLSLGGVTAQRSQLSKGADSVFGILLIAKDLSMLRWSLNRGDSSAEGRHV